MSNQTIDCQHVVNAVQCNETTIDESNSLSCGDSLVGTNVGKGDVIGSRSPEAMYELSFVQSVSLVVTTCSRVTDFSTALLLFDSVPTPEDHYNATLLATHDEEHLYTKGGGSSLFFNGKLGSMPRHDYLVLHLEPTVYLARTLTTPLTAALQLTHHQPRPTRHTGWSWRVQSGTRRASSRSRCSAPTS
jgi:hypothetical protein